MNTKQILSPEEIKKQLPLTQTLEQQIKTHREEIKNIINNTDKRKLIIIGPCSAWPKEAVIEFATHIQKLQQQYRDTYKFILRCYTQKPRTTTGWTGPINQPNPFGEPNIEQGIKYCREMMIKITQLGLPIADEALFTHKSGYLDDLLSWIAIGARSSEDQEHRIYASMISHPVGLKNPTSGSIDIGINSVIAAQHPHTFLLHTTQITTQGNPNAHLILRGGNKKSNISQKELEYASEMLQKSTLNPSIIVDLSHDNSIDEQGNKNPHKQKELFESIIKNIKANENLNSTIKGFMIESFLKTGKQSIEQNSYESIDKGGLSITDSCLGVDEIKILLNNLNY